MLPRDDTLAHWHSLDTPSHQFWPGRCLRKPLGGARASFSRRGGRRSAGTLCRCDLHPDPLQASCDAPEPKEAGAAGAAEAAAASKASAASSSAAASVASASSSKFLTFARLLKKAYHDGWTEKKGEEAQPSRLESIKRLDDDRFTPHSDLLDEAEMEWQEHLVKASRKLPPKAASHLAVDMQEVAPNAVHRDPWRDITGASDNVIEVKVDLDRVGQAGLAKAAEHTTRQAKKDRLYEAGALTSEIDAVR